MADLHLIGSELLPRRPMMRPLSRRCIAAGAYNQVTEPPNLESHTPIRSLVEPHPPPVINQAPIRRPTWPGWPIPADMWQRLAYWLAGAAYELEPAPQLTI